jgi:hypothetical protein
MAAKYDTRVMKKGSLTVTISKEARSDSAGDRLEAFLKILAAVASGNRPDNTLPGTPPPSIDNTLPEPPVAPVDPVYPDNTLPPEPPEAVQLPTWTGEHAKEIAKIILGHCVQCPTSQPKK